MASAAAPERHMTDPVPSAGRAIEVRRWLVGHGEDGPGGPADDAGVGLEGRRHHDRVNDVGRLEIAARRQQRVPDLDRFPGASLLPR